jgi:hypothetical protein
VTDDAVAVVLDRAAECVSDDIELVDVPAGQSFHGPNDTATMMRQLGLMPPAGSRAEKSRPR